MLIWSHRQGVRTRNVRGPVGEDTVQRENTGVLTKHGSSPSRRRNTKFKCVSVTRDKTKAVGRNLVVEIILRL